MAIQLVSDQQPMLMLALEVVQKIQTSWDEVQKGAFTYRRQNRDSRPLESSSWIGQEISEFERDLRKAEELTGTVESFLESIRQAAQDDEKARELDQLTDEPDLSKVIKAFEQNFVSDATVKIGNLVKAFEDWSKFAGSRTAKSTLPVPLSRRVEQLDRKQKTLADELGKDYDNELILRLLTRVARYRPLTIAESLRLDDAAKLEWKVKNQPSVRRTDWYGDDGR